jgi:hypothetical protein
VAAVASPGSKADLSPTSAEEKKTSTPIRLLS